MTDGAVVRIAKGARLDKPLLLVFARSATQGRLVTTRNIIELGDGAHATVIEAHVALPGAAPGQANTLSDVTLGDTGASRPRQVHAGRRGGEPPRHVDHAGSARRAAAYHAFQLTAGHGWCATSLCVTFAGEGGRLDVSPAGVPRGGSELIDTTLGASITPCPAARAASCSRAY